MKEKKEMTLEEMQQRVIELSVEIARLRKILSIRQNEFNKLDTAIYKEIHEQQENENEQATTPDDNE